MIRQLTVAGLLASSFILLSCSTSPTGRSHLALYNGDLSAEGEKSFEEIKKQEKLSTRADLNAYVQCVASHIVHQVPDQYGYQPEQWEVVVFDSEQVNAFALPGAKIGVYTGLLQVAHDQDQLASVIGHEVGHVMAKHSQERMSNQILAGAITVAAGAALSDSQYQKEAMMVLGVGATYGLILPFSRVHESEADEIGQELMAQAGFNPQGAVVMWQNMAKATQGKTPPELLSTHPSPSTRIDKLTAGLKEFSPMYQNARAEGRQPNCQRPK